MPSQTDCRLPAATNAVAEQEDEVLNAFTAESAFDLELACRESRVWIEAVLQEPFDEPDTSAGFHSGLRTGQRLCRFINCIMSNAVRKINRITVAFACMENITCFLEACRKFGLRDTQLFVSSDLYGGAEVGTVSGGDEEEKQANQQKDKDRKLRDVCVTIYWLGRAVRELKDYSGPQLNLAAFAKLSCAWCTETVHEDNYFTLGPRTFHNRCFFCGVCGSRPADTAHASPTYTWDRPLEKLVCSDCRCSRCTEPLLRNRLRRVDGTMEKLCPRCDVDNVCAACSAVLDISSAVVCNGQKYCPACVCGNRDCSRPLGKDSSKVDGVGYCADCLCAGCQGLPGPHSVQVGGAKYCPQCVCGNRGCRRPLVDGQFREVKGGRFCRSCLCPVCGGVPDSDAVVVGGAQYCRSCCCANPACMAPVEKGKGAVVNGKLYCTDCICHRPGCGQWAGLTPATHSGQKYCPICVCADEKCRAPLDMDGPEGKDGNQIGAQRYCDDCMCHATGCGKVAGDTAVEVGGRKYCHDCVCADPGCRNPLEPGQCVYVPATPDFLGGRVCKACLCAACGAVGERNGFMRWKNQRYCRDCCCAGCKLPLPAHMGKTARTNEDPGRRRYCRHCVCANCMSTMKRSDGRTSFQGMPFCLRCVCRQCSQPLAGVRAKGAVEQSDGRRVCVLCLCATCGVTVSSKSGLRYSGLWYCPNCVCASCSKPGVAGRGGPLSYVDGKGYCRACRCWQCEQPLAGCKGEYNGKAYCRDCVCHSCQLPAQAETRVCEGGKTYCASCVCVQCNIPLEMTNHRAFGDVRVCLQCACARCGRPRHSKGLPPEEPFVAVGNRLICAHCLCISCKGPLGDNEYDYCRNCTCHGCGCLLDDDEATYCDECGAGRPDFKSKAQRRQEKKAHGALKSTPVQARVNQRVDIAPPASVKARMPNGVLAGPRSPCAAHCRSDKQPISRKESGCPKCGKELLGSIIKALGRDYHAHCFVCSMCSVSLRGGFMMHNNQPCCATCACRAAGLPNCCACGQTVSGSYVTFGGGLAWHERCLQCAQCRQGLAGRSYRLENDRPVCNACY